MEKNPQLNPKKSQDTSTPSNKRPYKSKFKEGYVTPPNYITELIFEKRHEFFNNGRCPENFWSNKKYTGPYRGQVIQASKLLKNYRAESVAKALQDKRAKFIFKLQDKKLIPIIEEYEKQVKEKVVDKSDNSKVRISKPFGNKKNKFGEL